jgi:hypothetical protein
VESVEALLVSIGRPFGLGRCRSAEEPLREARAIFERLGAVPLVAETDGLLARVG